MLPVWVLLALLAPQSFSPLATGAVLDETPIGQTPTPADQVVQDDGAYYALVAQLRDFFEEDLKFNVPRNASELLAALRTNPGPLDLGPSIQEGWPAYFDAFGLQPTLDELEALHQFRLRWPHLAREVEVLAAEVARAQVARDLAFSALTPQDWAALPYILDILLIAGPDALPPEAFETLDRVNIRLMTDAAGTLLAATDRATPAIHEAMRADDMLDAAVPPFLRDRNALKDPAGLLDALLPGDAPEVADLPLADAIALLVQAAGYQGAADADLAARLPPDLQRPLARIILALAAEAKAEPVDPGLGVASMIAAQLPDLVRAAYNLSLASNGEAMSLRGTARPVAQLPARPLEAPRAVLRDMLGPAGPTSETSFLDGLAALHASLDMPLTPQQRRHAAAAQERLPEPLARAMGSVFAAQARHHNELSEDSPVPAQALALRDEAQRIASSGGALTIDEISILQRSATAENDLRDLQGEIVGALVEAILAVHESISPGFSMPMSSHTLPIQSPYEDVVLDTGVVLIMDGSDSIIDATRFPGTRALILDLGGNDDYRMPIATVHPTPGTGTLESPATARTSIAIDLDGHDRYEAVGEYGLGAAHGTPNAPAFAFLFDALGDDRYLAGNKALGWASDGIAIVVDNAGNDNYRTQRGLAAATTTSPASTAAAVFLDVFGNDRYAAVTPRSFAHIEPASKSPLTYVAFVDAFGNDIYEAPCYDAPRPCFGTPRGNDPSPAAGVIIFIDIQGRDAYPRPGDPYPELSTPAETDGWRLVIVPQLGTITLPDGIGGPGGIGDPDGDGHPDAIEGIAGTNPKDPTSYPWGLPPPPAPIPDIRPYANPRNILVNLPGLLAIGLPGTTTYEPYYVLSIDLGMENRPDDLYLNATARNGFAIDLGGNDTYTPKPIAGRSVAALAVVTPEDLIEDHLTSLSGQPLPKMMVAMLIDLGGNDKYETRNASAASILTPQGIAIFLDTSGDDTHHAHRGRSQAYVDAGSISTGTFTQTLPPSDPDPNNPGSVFIRIESGAAYFLELGGNDTYIAPTQGVVDVAHAGSNLTSNTTTITTPGASVNTNPRPGSSPVGTSTRVGISSLVARADTRPSPTAIFLDAAGVDTYETGEPPRRASERDKYQGAVRGNLSLGAIAAFLELDGLDTYHFSDTDAGRINISSEKRGRLRIAPLDRGAADAVAVFFDTDAGTSQTGAPPPDNDEDGTPDAIEAASGTRSESAAESPLATPGFRVFMPRIGFAIGETTTTVYRADLELALSIDLGGSDTYRHRAGSTTARFGAAVLLDLAGDDIYDWNGSSPLDTFFGPRVKAHQADADARYDTAPWTLAINALLESGGVNNPGGIYGGLLADGRQWPHPSAHTNALNVVESFYGGAQGAAVMGLGLLVDEDGRDTFLMNTSIRGCPSCATPGALGVAGFGQGAGLLGVGVLVLRGAGGNSLDALVNATHPSGIATARTYAQGAGLYGIGILESENASAPDQYRLASSAGAPLFASNATTGQGYAFRGLGALVDGGGNNALIAQSLAQAAAEGRTSGDPGPLLQDFINRRDATIGSSIVRAPWAYPEGSTALLLLVGIGDDRLVSNHTSQSYASGPGSLALLFDQEGDDHRTMQGPADPAQATIVPDPASGIDLLYGQAAGRTGGTAALFDDRGNDRYVLNGTGGQGFADKGVGVLVDASGNDQYYGKGYAQGAVGVIEFALEPSPADGNPNAANPGLAASSLAFLLDRSGRDQFSLPSASRGQGSVDVFRVPRPTGWTEGIGGSTTRGRVGSVALFVDAGGDDRYVNALARQTPQAGNNRQWTTEPNVPSWSGTASVATAVNTTLIGRGVDNETLTRAYAQLVAPAGIGRIHVPSGILSESVVINVSLNTSADSLLSPPLVDRVDFFINGTHVGRGATSSDGGYRFLWNTSEMVEDRPSYPDGYYRLSAEIFPRAGTPDFLGRRVAVDGEPFTVRDLVVPVDNPPVARGPSIDGYVSSFAPIPVTTWIDRDFERCAGGPCQLNVYLENIPPGRDDWALPVMVPPLRGPYEPDNCTVAACRATLDILHGGGRAYLFWTPPTQETSNVVGYTVYRQIGSLPVEFRGFVDAQVPKRALDTNGAMRHWFVDSSWADAKYWVNVLRDRSGALRETEALPAEMGTFTLATASTRAGPVSGLQGVGFQGGLHVVWRAAEFADAYNLSVQIAGASPTYTTLGSAVVCNTTTSVCSWTKLGLQLDTNYEVRVKPLLGAQPSPIQMVPRVIQTSPGHTLKVDLFPADADHMPDVNARMRLFEGSVGGGQYHTFLWDAREFPEGNYVVETSVLETTNGALNPRWAVKRQNITLDRAPPSTQLAITQVTGRAPGGAVGVKIPFTVDEQGSGTMATYFYVRPTDGLWPTQPSVVAPAGVTHLALPGVTHGDEIEIAAVSVDNTSNFEFIRTPTPWPTTVRDAFYSALDGSRSYITRIDLSPPVGTAQALNAAARPGQHVRIAAQAFDVGSGIGRVTAHIGGQAVPMSWVIYDRWAVDWVANGEDAEHQVWITIADHGNNEVEVFAGSVIVDGTPPNIEEAIVTFNERPAGRPSEVGSLRVVATDELSPSGALTVRADVSAVSTQLLAIGAYDPLTGAYVATFPLDKLHVGQANVTVTVSDRAGNVATASSVVRVNLTRPGIPHPIIRAGPDFLRVSWNTSDQAYGRVDYGLGPQLGRTTVEGPNGTGHEVLVTGLEPDTEYYLVAVSANDAGVETRSGIVSVRTRPPILIHIDALNDTIYSAAQTTVRLEAFHYEGVPIVADLEVILLAPRGAPHVVGAARGVTRFANITLDLAGSRDGNYSLLVRASGDEFRGLSDPIAFMLDRVQPRIEPPEAFVLAPGHNLTLRVLERGSGISVSGVDWRVGGRPCAASLAGDTLRCLIPLNVTEDSTTVTVFVPDRSGNAARFSGSFHVDRYPPAILEPRVSSVEGFPALRPDSRARVNVGVNDIALDRVEAQTPFTGSRRVPLTETTPGQWTATFDVPSDAPEGHVEILVEAIDTFGRTSQARPSTVIDAQPPRLVDAHANADGPTRARLVLTTNEPTRVVARARGLAGDVENRSLDFAVSHVLYLSGLRPGNMTIVRLTATDRAGHDLETILHVTMRPDVRPPSAVDRLAAEDRGDGLIRLTWAAASDDIGVAGYRVVRSMANATKTFETNETHLSDFAAAGHPIRYEVVAVDASGNVGAPASVELQSSPIPHLAHGTVDPPVGGPGLYRYEILLTQAGGEPPEVGVRVNGVMHAMRRTAESCQTGCTYIGTVRLGAESLATGPHQYSFHVTTGAFLERWPAVGELYGPVVLTTGEAPTEVDPQRTVAGIPVTLTFAATFVAVLFAARVRNIRWRWFR